MWASPGVTAEEVERRGLRYAEVKVRPSAADLEKIAELAENGRLRVIVDATFSLDEAQKAHELLETGRVRGKIALIP